jgi:hypothetical protein
MVEYLRYKVDVTLTEPMLGSSPSDPKVYEQFIAARKRSDAEDRGDEAQTLPAEEQEKIGFSVYHRDEKGVFIFDYKLRGFLKEAAACMTGKTEMAAFRSKIDKWVFVSPRRLYLMNGEGTLKEPHGTEQRPVRAMTAQGPRITLKKSELVNPGTHFTAEIQVLPLGQREITEDRLKQWLEYGQFSGLGEWRTGSFGRFEFKLEALGKNS